MSLTGVTSDEMITQGSENITIPVRTEMISFYKNLKGWYWFYREYGKLDQAKFTRYRY